MDRGVLLALFNNAALLLVLSVVFEVTYFLPSRYHRLQPVFSGILIALICSAVMSMPLKLQSGIIFDTRSILISVTALIFGVIPTVITVLVAVIFRLFVGGIGTLTGISVILSSALIGLAWRRWLYSKSIKRQWLNIFAMSVCVHITMLACMFLLPESDKFHVIRAISIPVMLVYPIATVLLCLLLARQQTLKRTQDQLKQSEERFKMLFDKAPLGYQSLDFNGNFIDVNQQWCALLGYTQDEVIGKWFGDFLSPENRKVFLQRFPLFKEQGFIHSEFEVLHKSGRSLFISFEGKIGYDFDGAFLQTHCILQDITSQKAAETALAESEKKYRNIAENMSDVVWQTDMNLKTTYVSPSVEKLLGESPEKHLERTLEEKFPEQTQNKLRSLFFEEIEKEKDPNINKNRSRTIEVEHYKADGSVIWIEMNISIMRDMEGNAIGFLGVTRDIMQRKLAEQALRESERSKSVLLSNLPGMAYRCNHDRERTMQFVSAGSIKLTGYPPESLIHNRDRSFKELISPEYRDSLWKAWEQALSQRLPFKYEYEIKTSEGERKWVLEMGEGIYDENENVEALEGIIIDISARKELESRLKYINEHDSWTGLYNIIHFRNVLNSEGGFQTTGKSAVIGIDLSEINLVSRNYGFNYSYELIKKVANELKTLRSDDRELFHIYENRFAFYIKAYKDQRELMAFCEVVSYKLGSLLTSERISGGIGIVEINENNESNKNNDRDIDRIIRNLMLASEKAGSNMSRDFDYCFYGSEMEDQVKREQEIEVELSHIAAQENTDRFFLQFQPILDIKTNKIGSFEALARLNSVSYGCVSPLEFIPIAEKTKLIIPLGHQIIIQAFRFLKMLKEHGYDAITISINISIIQLMRKDFVKNLIAVIEDMHINPTDVGIEVTESIFASNFQEINKILGELKEFGIQIAIDDFGTGYSSLSRERELNVNSLKIDQSFIRKLLLLKVEEAISGDIISIAHKLGHSAIAEGVEDERQLQYLKNHDCDYVQGYLIGKPLDKETALDFLKKQISD